MSDPVPAAGLPLIAILGPTASGKSALAVCLAEKFGGEVIACDSTQVYRGFDVGTAKPTPAERRGIPHNMLDIVSPSEIFTAGEYRNRALEVLADLRCRARLPILTVGTGLYFRALMEGLADAPKRSERLRERLNEIEARHGNAYLHKMLRRLDSTAAERISANDRQKLVRALEVCVLAGKSLTEVHKSGRSGLQGYTAFKIGLNPPRAALYARIEHRVHSMLDRGWIDEVAALVAAGTPATAKPFEFIGYRELRQHFGSAHPLADTIAAIAQATRRYAKRQLTWFRRESGVQWFGGFGDDPAVLLSVANYLEPRVHESRRSSLPIDLHC
jgi:tRNA dimethylallyltransferase